MSEPIDDKAFDEYLSRQSQVSRQYRGLQGADVPPDLERRVLDQASHAVEKKPRSKARVWKTWSVPVALAASTVLTLAVVIESGLEPKPVMPSEVSARRGSAVEPTASTQDATGQSTSALSLPGVEEPLPAAAPAASPPEPRADRSRQEEAFKTKSQAEAQRRPSEEKRIEEVTTTRSRDVPQVQQSPMAVLTLEDSKEMDEDVNPAPAPIAPPPTTAISQVASERPIAAPPPARAQAGAAREEVTAPAEGRAANAQEPAGLEEVTMTGQRRQTRTIAGPRGTLMRLGESAADDSQADSQEQRRQDDPARWLEFIRELRRDRKTEEADRQWTEFRRIYPAYAVAETDSARPQR